MTSLQTASVQPRLSNVHSLALSFLTLCLFFAGAASVADSAQDFTLQGPKRKLQHTFITRPGCFGYGHIEFEGIPIFQRPLTTRNPDACCEACQERDDCVGWEFRACCNHCNLWSDITKVNQCDRGDCVAGITSEEHRYRQDVEYKEVPGERRFNGLAMTCEEMSYYSDISSVMMACNTVERRCAPASEKVEKVTLPYVGPDCEFDENVNYYGYDYNNGFTALTLTPADCCRRCMRDRGCHAWTRTYSGQCWLKYEIPPEADWREVQGDVSGKRQHFRAKCGPTFRGFFIDSWGPDQKLVPEGPVETHEECCQQCIEHTSCLVWSFYEGECRLLFSPNNNMVEQPDAISSFAETAPMECNGERSDSTVRPLDIAQAYNVDCASILISGPSESRPNCRGRQEAERIFNDAYERTRRVV